MEFAYVQREAEFRPAMAEVVQDLMGATEEARTVDDCGELSPVTAEYELSVNCSL